MKIICFSLCIQLILSDISEMCYNKGISLKQRQNQKKYFNQSLSSCFRKCKLDPECYFWVLVQPGTWNSRRCTTMTDYEFAAKSDFDVTGWKYCHHLPARCNCGEHNSHSRIVGGSRVAVSNSLF